MQARTWLLVWSSVLLLGCGFVGRILQRNISAPETKPVAHKLHDPVRSDARLAVLWIGHATALVQLDDKFVLTDPVFTHSVGQLSPRLVEPGLDPEHLPALAAVVISHMHFDHLSFGSLDQIEDRTPLALVPPGVKASMPRYAFEIRELDRWQSYEKDGLRITAVPVRHVGGRYGIDVAFEPKAFTGYVIEYHGLSVYFGGDTAYAPNAFRATRERFPNLALALLPICPDAPRHFMHHTHVDSSEALDAFALLGARWMVPIHFDTFINSDDMPGGCGRELRWQVYRHGLADDRVAILEIGEQRVLMSATARTAGTSTPR
ncbi:MAG TPA: MBL fold metallo-hydrolase [Polyangiales bacterium]|nr:MBL fold metallo-hydrolase [Polyangiales bacterium]